MITVERYTEAHKDAWDAFVRESKNGTFLFLRAYMDYHADRFTDYSFLFFEEGELVALLPACERRGVRATLFSHAGLTYGGLVMSPRSTTVQVCRIFEALMAHLRANGISEFYYKPVPHIYHRYPSEEDLYALLHVCGAQIVGRSASTTLDLQHRLPMRERRLRYVRAAKRKGMQVVPSADFAAYWRILCAVLADKYEAEPVHTLQEIEMLHRRFPDNIHLLLTVLDDKTLSGAVLFVTDTCVHAQYLCSSSEGDAHHANELMVDYILEHYSQLRYFDFGTSADEGPLGLNESLIHSKEGYGCRAIMYDTYHVRV